MLAIGVIGLLAAATARATDGPGGTDTLRWVNPNGGAWTDAANWSPANVPDSDNEVAVMDSMAGHAPYTVTLDGSLVVGGLKIRAAYATLDVSHGQFRLEGVPVNQGTLRLSGGTDMYINRPLFMNEGGTISIGAPGATIQLRMPFNVAGTLNNFRGGRIYLDGGGLYLFCSSLLEGTIERRSGDEEVVVEYAVPQNTVIAPNTVVRVAGLMDLLAAGTSLVNHGTLIVSGTFQGPAGGYSNSLTGTGQMVLDEGRIMTGNENTGVLINEAGHTIRGCGTILAPIINYGTIESSCDYSALNIVSPVENRGVIRDRSGILWIHGSRARMTNAGTLSVTGGTVWIDEGASIDNRMGVIGAYGRPIELGRGTHASVQGGVIEGTGNGTVHNQGTVTLRDVTLSPGATFRTWPGATTHVTGYRLTNQGTMRVQGALAVGPTTDYVQSGGVTALESGSLGAAREIQIQGGELRGHGTIAGSVANGGTVSPDPLLGALTIQGDYRQLAGGRLAVGLAGSGPGQVSRLGVTGAANLDGAFEVSAVGGYDPVPGMPYPVLSYGSVAGTFASYVGNLAGSLDIAPVYDADGMDLVVTGQVGVGDPVTPQALRFYRRGGSRDAAFVIELPREARLTVRAYDARGREVARLADGLTPAGVHRLALRGVATSGDLPSGVYFARATIADPGGVETLTARVVTLS